MSVDYTRRFGGVARLYGETGAARLRGSSICVVGIGGVGSWAIEALARTGIGRLTAIDLDMVSESNTNRQLHALDDEYGKAKVDVIGQRIRQINPNCEITCIEDFVSLENMSEVLTPNFDVVIDAIDQTRIKAAMIAHCCKLNIPIIVTGAAGGQIDPTRIVVADLTETIQDPLLARVRSILRKEYGFSRGGGGKFGVSAIFSTEPLSYPSKGESCSNGSGPTGLNCSGFGSTVCVTSVFGMVAASRAIDSVIRK